MGGGSGWQMDGAIWGACGTGVCLLRVALICAAFPTGGLQHRDMAGPLGREASEEAHSKWRALAERRCIQVYLPRRYSEWSLLLQRWPLHILESALQSHSTMQVEPTERLLHTHSKVLDGNRSSKTLLLLPPPAAGASLPAQGPSNCLGQVAVPEGQPPRLEPRWPNPTD